MSKQDRLREIPTSTTTASDGNVHMGSREPFATLPGSELDQHFLPNAQVNFLNFQDSVLFYVLTVSDLRCFCV